MPLPAENGKAVCERSGALALEWRGSGVSSACRVRIAAMTERGIYAASSGEWESSGGTFRSVGVELEVKRSKLRVPSPNCRHDGTRHLCRFKRRMGKKCATVS